MTSLVLERDPVATSIKVTSESLIVELDDGRFLSVPLTWYPRLAQATAAEHDHWVLWGNGYGIEWPAIDEHISIEGLLAGRRSGESPSSLERWRATRRK